MNQDPGMDLRPSTEEFISLLDAFSGNRLSRRHDLGILVELASLPEIKDALHRLSFYAKFVSRCHGIMTRIGPSGEGYDKLVAQLTESTEKAKELLRRMLGVASPEINTHFASTYLSMTPASFQNLLALFYDLGWYKNWHIDISRGAE